MFLIAVHAHSKWPEVFVMKETTATKTIQILCVIFGRFGLPEQVVTDNGPQFVSEDFSHFLKSNGIKHIRCAPYHPASNGLAERFVQSLKMALKSTVNSGLSLQHHFSNFLLKYCSTPHATTGVSPSSLFLQVNSQAETPQSTESDPSDLDIPLGDTTSIGVPPEKSLLHLSPLVRIRT